MTLWKCVKPHLSYMSIQYMYISTGTYSTGTYSTCTYSTCTYSTCTYSTCTYSTCTYSTCTYSMCTLGKLVQCTSIGSYHVKVWQTCADCPEHWACFDWLYLKSKNKTSCETTSLTIPYCLYINNNYNIQNITISGAVGQPS